MIDPVCNEHGAMFEREVLEKIYETQRKEPEIIERPGIKYAIQVWVEHLTSQQLELNEFAQKAVEQRRKKSEFVNNPIDTLESDEIQMKSF